MSCTPAESLAIAAFGVLVFVGGYGTWNLSGFLKDIELRHPVVYARLGNPSFPRTSESDSHSITILRFLLKNEYKELNDPKLQLAAHRMKVAFVISALAVAAFLVSLFLAPCVRELAALACLRAP